MIKKHESLGNTCVKSVCSDLSSYLVSMEICLIHSHLYDMSTFQNRLTTAFPLLVQGKLITFIENIRQVISCPVTFWYH